MVDLKREVALSLEVYIRVIAMYLRDNNYLYASTAALYFLIFSGRLPISIRA